MVCEADGISRRLEAAMLSVQVLAISERPDVLEQVRELGRANSRTLGFLPVGAYEHCARNDEILVATANSTVVGYLLFRRRKRSHSVAITHLCVDESYRRQSVARSLVEALKHRERQATGIDLWCRRDYSAAAVWPKLGFIARAEREGRAGDLVHWCFRSAEAAQREFLWVEDEGTTTIAAIDAVVFFDLIPDDGLPTPSTRRNRGDSRALLADWLQPHIDLCVTAELENEIQKAPTPERREAARTHRRRSFRELPTDDAAFQQALVGLAPLLPGRTLEPDRRQIARAASADADSFITKDREILSKRHKIYDAVGVSIVSPAEFVVQIDSQLNQGNYRAARVDGSLFESQRLTELPDDIMIRFLNSSGGERKAALRGILQKSLVDPASSQVRVVRSEQGDDVALFAFRLDLDGSLRELAVDVIRVVARPRVAPVLAHAIAKTIVLASISAGCASTRVVDSAVSQLSASALRALGFRRDKHSWLKLHNRAVAPGARMASALRGRPFVESASAEYARVLGDAIDHSISTSNVEDLLAAERLLWPAKFEDLTLPCYVIPIRPSWAMHLFDSELASRDLFGASAELAFSDENVYYRAAKPSTVLAPARALWYVSSNPRFPGSGAIRAASYVDEVRIDKPKALLRDYERIGVFRWEHLLQIAGGRSDRDIMAIRFSRAEPLSKPLGFSEFQELLAHHGQKRNQLQSITKISSACHFDTYRRAQ